MTSVGVNLKIFQARIPDAQVELEFGSSNPDHARFFRGRLDLPAQYDGTVTANSYATISNSFYLATGH